MAYRGVRSSSKRIEEQQAGGLSVIQDDFWAQPCREMKDGG
jgi:hypothetical protein